MKCVLKGNRFRSIGNYSMRISKTYKIFQSFRIYIRIAVKDPPTFTRILFYAYLIEDRIA